MTARPAPRPEEARPADGSCSQWVGAELRYCRATDGVHRYQEGHRCGPHSPRAAAGLPELPDSPGIPAYNREATVTTQTATSAGVQHLIAALNAAHTLGIKFSVGPNPHIGWDPVAQKYAAAADIPRDEEFEATWAGGHALVIEYGDCEMYGRCQCGERLGMNKPDKPLDAFAEPWERHVMGLGR